MLKRLSCLALVLLLGGSVFVAGAQVKSEHICAMAAMEMMPGMDGMSCCGTEQAGAPNVEHDDMLNCCIAIPPSPGSSGTTFKLRTPSVSFAVVRPEIALAPIQSRRHEHLSTQVFLLIFGGFIFLAAAREKLYRAQRDHKLATTGAYAYVRHPRYVAFLVIMFGFLLQCRRC